MVGYEKAKVHGKLTAEIGKGVAINKNGLGVELDSKNSTVRLGKIGVVVHANEVAWPWVEKLDFMCMNL